MHVLDVDAIDDPYAMQHIPQRLFREERVLGTEQAAKMHEGDDKLLQSRLQALWYFKQRGGWPKEVR